MAQHAQMEQKTWNQNHHLAYSSPIQSNKSCQAKCIIDNQITMPCEEVLNTLTEKAMAQNTLSL